MSEVHYAVSILQDVDQIYNDDLIAKISRAINVKKISLYRFSLIKEFITRNISKKIVKKIRDRAGEFLSGI